MHASTVLTRALSLLCLVALLAPGCTSRGTGPRLRDGGEDGTDSGTSLVDAGPRPDTGLPPFMDCTEAARWIYLVDSGRALLRYEPDSGTLTPIGTVSCTSGATPFSMAVDRQANAYVLHQDHRIYRVSTVDASCTASSFVPDQLGFELFGMGFVSDAEGSDRETLFIAGGPEAGIGSGSSVLGSIDTSTWTVSRIGNVGGSPELTGTGTAQLWGFFPDSMPMSVRQIDKGTGATLREIDVSEIDSFGLGGGAQAWAFAFWGGRYYIFYQGILDDTTGIYRVTPDTGVVETVRTNIGFRIVGAGVSTCAPTILI